jgi:hypothetical protein
MIYIGVDLGYAGETTIAVVRTEDLKNRFTFSSLREGTEFEDILKHVYDLMVKLKVPPENVSSPRHPAFEHELSKRFKRT